MLSPDTVRVRHILDAARKAMGFVESRSRPDLDADHMRSLALVRLLEVIGEAARGISREFPEAHPEVAWSKMAGMRDRLIHGYFDVNLDVVWKTVADDLPVLLDQLEKIVPAEDSR